MPVSGEEFLNHEPASPVSETACGGTDDTDSRTVLNDELKTIFI
jgi:hypothetical protein